MTRTITHSEFVNAAGDGVYVSTVHYANPSERVAGDAAVQRVVVAPAFVPFGDKGEPFDPPEYPMGSANVPGDYIPVNNGARCVWRHISALAGPPEGITQTEGYRAWQAAENARTAKVLEELPWPSDKAATWVGPPNCEGYGHTLAHAQHEAAIDGDGCTAGACLLTRGSD